MLIYQRVKDLANEKKISIRELETSLKFSNGTINKWDKRAPSDKLQKVAEYFHVSIDYLMGNTNDETISSSKADVFAKTQAGLFREVVKEQNLSDEDQEVLKDDLYDYLKMRAEFLKKQKSKNTGGK